MRIEINSDKDLVKEIRNKIKENDGHCACAIIFDEDNKCMCKEFREQITNGMVGECGCGLYIAVENN